MLRITGAVALLAALTFSAAAQAQQPSRPKLTTKEALMGKLGAPGEARSYSISPDNNHVAILSRREVTGADGKPVEKYIVSVDGVDGKPYDWIIDKSLTFSADSSTVAYVVQQEGAMFAVTGDKEGQPFYEIMNFQLFPAPKGDSFGYYARRKAGSRPLVVVAQEPGKEYDQVGNLTFSPDGKRFAYAAESGGQQFFVIDGMPQKDFARVSGPSFVFSPDSKRYAYAGVRAQGVTMVINGAEQPVVDEAVRAVFSPDSQHIAYAVRQGAKMNVLLDGKALPDYERLAGTTLIFSPDSQKLAYVAGKTVKTGDVTQDLFFYVVDDKPMSEYEQLVAGSLTFSPDSQHTAYVTVKDGRFVVVTDGKESEKGYDDVRLLQFSPDSAKAAYLARRGTRAYAVIGDEESPVYDAVTNLGFSLEGKHVGFVAKTEENFFVVIDGNQQQKYPGIVGDSFTFSPDGTHHAYEARRTERPFFVVNGAETGENDGSLRGSRIVFDDADTFHSLILRGNNIFRIEVTATPQ